MPAEIEKFARSERAWEEEQNEGGERTKSRRLDTLQIGGDGTIIAGVTLPICSRG